MTDYRFCRRLIEEIQKNIIKTQQSLDLKDCERLGGIYIPFPKKSYSRIEKLLKELNAMTEKFQIETTDDIKREIYVRIK